MAELFHRINNQGSVLGNVYLSSVDQEHAYIWKNGTFNDLGVPEGHISSVAYGINDSGTVVGYSNTGAPAKWAV